MPSRRFQRHQNERPRGSQDPSCESIPATCAVCISVQWSAVASFRWHSPHMPIAAIPHRDTWQGTFFLGQIDAAATVIQPQQYPKGWQGHRANAPAALFANGAFSAPIVWRQPIQGRPSQELAAEAAWRVRMARFDLCWRLPARRSPPVPSAAHASTHCRPLPACLQAEMVWPGRLDCSGGGGAGARALLPSDVHPQALHAPHARCTRPGPTLPCRYSRLGGAVPRCV